MATYVPLVALFYAECSFPFTFQYSLDGVLHSAGISRAFATSCPESEFLRRRE